MQRIILDIEGIIAEDWVTAFSVAVLVVHFAMGGLLGVEFDILRSGGIKL